MLGTILVIGSSERWAGGKTPRTEQYSTVVDRHGDQGRHVLRHVRGGQNRGSTLSGGEFKLAFMGSKVYS